MEKHSTEFSRIITLLREEKGTKQKTAAEDLGISQGLLSHYEKGKRECGLDFVVKIAKYYDVSADYLLGLSSDKKGIRLSYDNIYVEDTSSQDKIFRGNMAAVFSKKLIVNSINILFDMLQKCNNNGIIEEVSSFMFISIYKVFRLFVGSNDKNNKNLFRISPYVYQKYSDAHMSKSEAVAFSLLSGHKEAGYEPFLDDQCFKISNDTLAQTYPNSYSSIMNVVERAEKKILDEK